MMPAGERVAGVADGVVKQYTAFGESDDGEDDAAVPNLYDPFAAALLPGLQPVRKERKKSTGRIASGTDDFAIGIFPPAHSAATKETKITKSKDIRNDSKSMVSTNFVSMYGARFSSEICTRGCHWFPRLFA
jgi:hypothetical protein